MKLILVIFCLAMAWTLFCIDRSVRAADEAEMKKLDEEAKQWLAFHKTLL